MNDKIFLETSYPYFSLAFELLPVRPQHDYPLDIYVALADRLLYGIEDATGIRPPENMTGHKVAEYYFQTNNL